MDGQVVWAIVVAAGSGRRFGAAKQFELLDHERVVDISVRVARSVVDGVVLVVPPERVVEERGVPGGSTRAESVRAGLAAVPEGVDIVVVHDAARPMATATLYLRVIDAVRGGADAAIPGVPVADTIKVVDANGRVTSTPARDSLVAVQTPQAFRASVLRAAHAGGGEATDDATLVEMLGGSVIVVPGETDNRKLTVADDLAWARDRMAERATDASAVRR